MEIVPVKEISTQRSPKRQLVISPAEWGHKNADRLILVCKSPQDMSSMSEEDIRLDYKNFPAIGIIKSDGSVEVDPYFCVDQGLYENFLQLMEDLGLLLEANNFAELKLRIFFGNKS